jgi:hypothetical protein
MRRFLTALLLGVSVLSAQPAPSLAGYWEGAIQIPGTEMKIQVTLEGSGAAWSGRISIPPQGAKDLALGDVKVVGDAVSFVMPGIPGEPKFSGKLGKAGRIEGTFTQGGQAFPFGLARASVAAPVAAAAPKPDPQDREHGFPGFNAFPLKGSVRAGGAHPYFAVMVAGSGPTDRDWSNPLISLPSHGGRDFAAWLQGQGLGSLRYDKRFIGSRDPKLDISLDAQVGDIKAALKAARLLPEAKGKKLLLVGHSEGSLLSLLAAGEADAALLLALPGASMGKLIVLQVKGQLDGAGAPEDFKKQNLAYLEATLDAVRKDRDLPPAGADVAPGIVNLAKSLVRPETRGFVRATMDLDPWGSAQRLAVPCAVVWGDRDIQTWKPAAVPPEFKGTVLQIPEANHLFKRETRDKASLAGPAALTTYGDSTPLADLTPLAAWLKALK